MNRALLNKISRLTETESTGEAGSQHQHRKVNSSMSNDNKTISQLTSIQSATGEIVKDGHVVTGKLNLTTGSGELRLTLAEFDAIYAGMVRCWPTIRPIKQQVIVEQRLAVAAEKAQAREKLVADRVAAKAKAKAEREAKYAADKQAREEKKAAVTKAREEAAKAAAKAKEIAAKAREDAAKAAAKAKEVAAKAAAAKAKAAVKPANGKSKPS